MEDHGLTFTPEAVVGDFQRTIENIDSVPAHFVSNANEIRHQEWVNRHERICFVLMVHSGHQIGYAGPGLAK
jgi:hypothetical protein